jgi:cation-transporting P-type ATPase 13A2
LIDISSASFHTIPADLILLSGEAIVNESMLTGESVPVSKVPIDPTLISSIGLGNEVASLKLAKHVLFNGTRVVRIRKTQAMGKGKEKEVEAVALVAWTGKKIEIQKSRICLVFLIGFNTTKGALVRSMLFPRPMG